MNWEAVGAISEGVGAIAVVLTLIYLAMQIRQNTSQQKREEIVSVQVGQNKLVEQLQDPSLVRAYVRVTDGNTPVSTADRARTIFWVIQYINHFEIVFDLYHDGSLDDDRYEHWESIAVSVVATKGIRAWWDGESGKLAFRPKVRDLIDQKLNDAENPPTPFNRGWEIMNPESWRDVELDDVARGT